MASVSYRGAQVVESGTVGSSMYELEWEERSGLHGKQTVPVRFDRAEADLAIDNLVKQNCTLVRVWVSPSVYAAFVASLNAMAAPTPPAPASRFGGHQLLTLIHANGFECMLCQQQFTYAQYTSATPLPPCPGKQPAPTPPALDPADYQCDACLVTLQAVPAVPHLGECPACFLVFNLGKCVEVVLGRVTCSRLTTPAAITQYNQAAAQAAMGVGKGSQAGPSVPSGWGFIGLGDDDEPTPAAAPKTYEKCAECSREMSPTLDKYWGKEPWMESLCVDCRWKRGSR